MPTLQLGPVTLHLIDDNALDGERLAELLNHAPTQIVTFNSLMFMQGVRDRSFAKILSGPALSVCDSVGIAWAARMLTGRNIVRLPGIDLLHRICRVAAGLGKRIFLLGSRPGVAEAAALRLRQLYPAIIVAGTHHGYFAPAEESQIVEEIRQSRADILFVAMALPDQEQWIARRINELGVALAMGVGGSFDVLSGRLRRAPLWMQRGGVEWAFRFVQQPSRLFRITKLAAFAATVMYYKLCVGQTASESGGGRS